MNNLNNLVIFCGQKGPRALLAETAELYMLLSVYEQLSISLAL